MASNRQRAQRHSRRGDHRAERDPKEGVQQARCDWDTHDVVGKGENQALLDVPHSGPALDFTSLSYDLAPMDFGPTRSVLSKKPKKATGGAARHISSQAPFPARSKTRTP